MPEPIEPLQPSAQPPSGFVGEAISQVKQEPVKSVISAFLMGLILSIFPVGRIISFFVGLALTLARPLLVVFGALKLWEEVARRRK